MIENDNIEIYENDIDLYLHQFCNEQNIEDIKKESQSVWNACLIYIYRHTFKIDNSFLKVKDNNNNAYDIEKVNLICDYYIYICSIYDKEISIIGFTRLTGISEDIIYTWNNSTNSSTYRNGKDRGKTTSKGNEIHKKLNKAHEESLANMLISGKRNPVGILGALNHHYSWNMPGVRETKESTPRISREEIRQLVQNDESTNDTIRLPGE